MGPRGYGSGWWLLACAALGACGPSHRVRGGPPRTQGPVEEVPALESEDGCGPFSPAALVACVDEARLRRDVETLARPRPPGSAAHEAVRELCRRRLEEMGYQVELEPYRGGVNVLGIKPGFSKASERVLVSAHYDHLVGCPGADDNASGVAAVLEAARVLASARFDRSLVVALWDEGEAGQLGSSHHARLAQQRGDDVVVAFAIEAIGYASREPDTQRVPERFDELFPDQALALIDDQQRGDFLTVVADIPSEDAARAVMQHAERSHLDAHLLTLTQAVKAKIKDKLHRSDHVSFWEVGFPALLLTDTGSFRNPHFHCKTASDRPDTLDYAFLSKSTGAAVGALAELLALR